MPSANAKARCFIEATGFIFLTIKLCFLFAFQVFLKLQIIKQSVLDIEGFKLKRPAIDADHTVVMPSSNVVLKVRFEWTRSFEASSTATSNQIHRAFPFGDNRVVSNRPGSLVGMNVPTPDNVDIMFVVDRCKLADSRVASC